MRKGREGGRGRKGGGEGERKEERGRGGREGGREGKGGREEERKEERGRGGREEKIM